ncbi:MAG TPA: hypothetical protein VG389_15475 [Myxococcota bacterium]|nr:hypothetical protein [Myxococcota bacterium]
MGTPSNIGSFEPRRGGGPAAGAERRHNKMFVTLHSEYHLHDDVCVAVRDRRTGDWFDRHRAVGCRLLGAFSLTQDGMMVPEPEPRTGHFLVFFGDRRDVVTSALQAIERPPKDAVQHYQLPPRSTN